MERLWAPWRRDFVVKGASAGEGDSAGCIFCALPGAADGPGNLILHRTPGAYVIMNKYPYSNGHLMVVPFRHTPDFTSLLPGEASEMILLAQRCVAVLRQRMNAHGFNVGFNLGKAAGAGIEEHVHLHVVPRWEGDHNMMTVLGGVRVIPEDLSRTYETLRPAFDSRG
ncbi:MAG: HIT domain-containing protein [Candidatus Tectomicrobia bacterium]|uniref:HIT domain-containing protein n=1 Tax=Tectimicrobiota bacterium TaxID=2528274 RepID=A0A932I0J8_UNCTE|nr:HIT domain-containing protein [Candidatus Tectomicrobia bacterium]